MIVFSNSENAELLAALNALDAIGFDIGALWNELENLDKQLRTIQRQSEYREYLGEGLHPEWLRRVRARLELHIARCIRDIQEILATRLQPSCKVLARFASFTISTTFPNDLRILYNDALAFDADCNRYMNRMFEKPTNRWIFGDVPKIAVSYATRQALCRIRSDLKNDQ